MSSIAGIVSRIGRLLPAALLFTLTDAATVQAGSSYPAVWSSDKETDDLRLNRDFPAIIDADRRSRTYGKVVNTARLDHVAGADLLNDLGLTDALGLKTQYGIPSSGIPSDALREAHHMNHDPIVVGKRRYLYLGGLVRVNVFRCDVSHPLRHAQLYQTAPSCRTEPTAILGSKEQTDPVSAT